MKSKMEKCKAKEDERQCIRAKEDEDASNVLKEQEHKMEKGQLGVVTFQVDLLSTVLFFLALASRFWRLTEPKNIVFDELHYGKYAAMYVKQTFFFDCHPPLGKQLIALAVYFAGFDGNFKFDQIGSPYAVGFPVWSLRMVPAFCGSLLVPTAYNILLQMGSGRWTAAATASLLILDNALLTQSRFALLDTILLQFAAGGILCLLKFMEEHKRSMFSLRWFLWLIGMSISLSCALCVKYIGFFSALLAIMVIGWDFWKMLGDIRISDRTLLKYCLVLVAAIVFLPVVIYLSAFYVHLSVLSKAGPHDNVMTSAFQASLELAQKKIRRKSAKNSNHPIQRARKPTSSNDRGGLASITRGQPLEVVHGSQITLRHTHGRPCWLHSHAHVYPIRYPDGRGSSHQQQVTCYSFKDVNNWWIVKRPSVNHLVVQDPVDPIRHGDLVQLVHGMTSRALNSHDVAAPVSPQNQEVSCYIDYNVSMTPQNIWKVDIINREAAGSDAWHTIRSQVRLVHLNTSQVLKFSGRQLPDWGFHQHEVVTDRLAKQEDAVWNVEEHRYTKSADQKDRERELGLAEFVPMTPTKLSFWEKFWEVQIKMFTVNQENVPDHVYSSEPLEWPLLTRGIAYWVQQDSNAQIHLLGNVAIWYVATASLIFYSMLLGFFILRRQREIYDLSEDAWKDFSGRGGIVLLLGYFLHFVPYFFVDRTLFLHHYLPALFYKILLTAHFIQQISHIIRLKMGSRWRHAFGLLIAAWLCAAVYVHLKFHVVSYGHRPLAIQDVLALRWKDTWDFIIHRP